MILKRDEDLMVPEKEIQDHLDTWYRGEHCNYGPKPPRRPHQYEDGLETYYLKGWLPPEPFIEKTHVITAFGSCFAAQVSGYLRDKGYNLGSPSRRQKSFVVSYGTGINNTFAVRQQFEWAFENRAFSDKLWWNKDKEYVGDSSGVREETKKIFLETDIFILTLGLSEVWYNKQTKEVFWRAIPQTHFNPEIHGFRVTNVQENRENIKKICKIIRKHRRSAKIILTLSPVPLSATFRPVSWGTASCVSKSILRVAIDEFMREDSTGKEFYWPSYEIVKEYMPDGMVDGLHPSDEALKVVMDSFGKYYLV